MRKLKGVARKTFASAIAAVLALALALPTTAFAAAGDLTVALSNPTATAVDVPGGDDVVNYLLLSVDPADDYTTGTYTIDATTPDNAPVEVAATPVLKNASDEVTYIKVPVPAGVTAGTITVDDGAVVLNAAAFTAGVAGVTAPETIYGEVPMGFAEFNHAITADITAVEPSDTFFVEGATVAVPEAFIASGGRGDWPTTGSQPAVDAISTATYGDSVHYVPSANLALNYADPQTKAPGNEVTGVKAVEVGISFDLLANATLLDAASAATEPSTAVLAKAAALTQKAETDIYKAQYLFADASWGAREDTAHNSGVATPWKPVTTTSELYGNNWTVRETQINFDLGSTSGTDFWSEYLEYLYGGYIENTDTGAREPLVFLQNIFTHRGHVNIDVSINNVLFPRFDSLGIPDDNFKVVLYAQGYEDIVVGGITLKEYADATAAIEQGATFNVNPDDDSTWFEDNALHIQGISPANLATYATSATLSKGNTAVNTDLYSFSVSDTELELLVEDAFFTGAYQGAYTISLTPETSTAVSKPLSLTINKWLDRPTLSSATGAPSAADSEADALVAYAADTVSFSDAEYARAIALTGRTASSIVDVTADNAPVTVSNVIKRVSSADPYALDLSTLTVGHTYRLSLITTNISTGETAATAATTTVYYITVVAPALEAELVSPTATPVSLLNGTIANYLLLEVTGGDYAAGVYAINDGTSDRVVSATPVLTDGDVVTYVKVPVPAGVTEGTLTVTINSSIPFLSEAFTAETAGVFAPATLYGKTSMTFSEFYYDVTAGITDVLPATTAFEVGGALAAPASFITAGTRQQWPANDTEAKVDAISSATYGDAVHFIPTGNYTINYPDPATQGAGHEVTAITSVDVGISVDLLANATLLDAADLATEQSDATLDKIASITRVATSKIYKVKYLRTDAGWGARASSPTSLLAASAWPSAPTAENPVYGGNFTNREVSVGFPDLPAELAADSYALLWENYLNNLYGGYVEDSQGHREPLVWLQNLFSHKFHDDFEVSLNEDVFGRFSSLDVSEPVTIVIFAKGLEDIVLEDISFKTFADNDASLEDGTTYYVSQGDTDSYFDDGQLRIVDLSHETLAEFIAADAEITKGGVAIDSSLYSIALDGFEAVVTFEPEFFTSPSLSGSYVISLVPATDDTHYKTYSFTINSLVERPTLIMTDAEPYVATETEPAVVPQGSLLSFSNEAYAKAVVLSGRSVSTITDVTPEGATAAPAIGAVLQLSGAAGSAYQIDTTALTVGHLYRINVLTTGYATAPVPSATTSQFFISVGEPPAPSDESWKRLSGDNRYDTMQEIIAEAFASSDTDTVIVATGEDFPDALAASGLAGIAGAPVILTESATLSAQAQETIEALEPDTIYIAGGPGSVTPEVEDSLKALVDDPTQVIRSAGDDRYLTALDIYAKGKDAGSWGTTAIIASGGNYADALAISPYSYSERAPIFLADPQDGLDANTTQVLKDALAAGDITNFIIAGGTGSVPDAVKSQLDYAVDDETVFTRLAGEDRYETSVAVANYTVDNTALTYHKLAAATGENFPDALAGGAFAGKIGTVLLLVSDDAAGRTGIESVVGSNSAVIGYGHVLGGPSTVSDTLKTALEAASARS
jgi:putative cell wall-binding protein